MPPTPHFSPRRIRHTLVPLQQAKPSSPNPLLVRPKHRLTCPDWCPHGLHASTGSTRGPCATSLPPAVMLSQVSYQPSQSSHCLLWPSGAPEPHGHVECPNHRPTHHRHSLQHSCQGSSPSSSDRTTHIVQSVRPDPLDLTGLCLILSHGLSYASIILLYLVLSILLDYTSTSDLRP